MGRKIPRKTFLASAASAGALLAAGPASGLAAAPTVPPPLSRAQARTLGAWCDVLAPGARAARVVDFVETQLGKSAEDALLSIRYFDWPPPWEAFYQQGLDAVDVAAEASFGAPPADLPAAERAALLQRLLDGSQGWSGPQPFFLFYLITRGDAVDVVYGVPAGYARIGLPYVPQVRPRSPW